MPPPKRRCLLLADGTTLACFQRSEHDAPTLVLEPNGRAYSFIAPNGSLSRHLTATSSSTHRAMVREAMRARNQFAFSTDDGRGSVDPYVHGVLLYKRALKESVSAKRLRQALQTRWPSGCLQVHTLYDESSGTFLMHSLDGRASMRLRGHGRLVDVEYTIQVNMSKETPSATQPEPSTYTTTTLRQTFSSAFPPPAFAFPTRLLLMVKDASQCDLQEVSVQPQSHESAVSLLPVNGAFTARPEFTALANSNETDGLTMTDVLRVASRPSKALYARVAVEVQEEITFLLYRRRKLSDPLLTIICELHDQSGLLECQTSEGSSICRWYDVRGRLQQQFPLTVLPPSSFFTPESSSAPSIASVCSHLEYIISSFMTATTSSVVSSIESEPLSCALVEQAENELGRFRAFADGHVRVAFADRTIVQIAGDRILCSFFFADGSCADMTVDSAPETHQRYIHQALEFADWAFATPEQRFARHLQRQQSELMVQQELHRIKVRCGMNTQQLDSPDLPDLSVMRSWNSTAVMTMANEPVDSGLSLVSVQRLQEETQRHMAHVESLLLQASRDTTQ